MDLNKLSIPARKFLIVTSLLACVFIVTIPLTLFVDDTFGPLAVLSFIGTIVFGFVTFIVSLNLNDKNGNQRKFQDFDRTHHLFLGRLRSAAILDLIIDVMRIDRVISEMEDKRFEAFLQANFPRDICRGILHVYERRKLRKPRSLHRSIAWLEADLDFRMKLQFIDLICRAAVFDRVLSKREKEFIFELSKDLRIPFKTTNSILQRHSFLDEEEAKRSREFVDKRTTPSNEEQLLKVMELDANCTSTDIKRKYRELVMRYHPDRMIDATEQELLSALLKFLEIQEAYDKLQTLRKFK